MNATQIIAAAQSWIGTPWLHQGRTREGIDCVGLIVMVLQACGWEPLHPEKVLMRNYERTATSDYVLEAMRGEAPEIGNREDLQPGDVVVFKYEEHQFAQHCGIITRRRANGDLFFVHADSEMGKVVEHRLVLVWRERFVAGFRMNYNG